MMRSQAGLPASYTWVGKPSASGSNTGKIIRITDVGTGGCLMFSDGTNWYPAGPITYTYSGPALAAPSNTNENIVATITIPAGLLGPKGSISGDILYSHTYSSNTKTMYIKFGGSLVSFMTKAVDYASQTRFSLFNNNSSSSQKAYPISPPYGGSGNVAMSSLAVNTGANANLTFSLQKATAGEALSVEGYVVIINPGY